MPKNSEDIIEIIEDLKSTNAQNNQAFRILLEEVNRKLEDLGDGKEFVFVRNALSDMKSSLTERFSEIADSIEKIQNENAENSSQNDIIELLNEKFKTAMSEFDENLDSLADKLSSSYDEFKLTTGENFTELKDSMLKITQALSVEKLELAENAKNAEINNERLISGIIQKINDFSAHFKEQSESFENKTQENFESLKESIGKKDKKSEIETNLQNYFSAYCQKITEISDIILELKKQISSTEIDYKEFSSIFSNELNKLNIDFEATYSNISDDLKEEFNNKFNNYQKLISDSTDNFSNGISQIQENLKSEFKSIVGDIQDKFATILGVLDKNVNLIERFESFGAELNLKMDILAKTDYSDNFGNIEAQNEQTQELIKTLHNKVDELLEESADKDENVGLINRHLKTLEEKVLLVASALNSSPNDEIAKMNNDLQELILGIDKNLSNINVQGLLPEITDLFEKTENKINSITEELKENQKSSFKEISSNLVSQSNLLDELNAKLDIFASSNETEILEDELLEIKEIILAQENLMKSAEGGITQKAENNFKDIIAKIDSVTQSISQHENNSEKIKENIIETIISVFNNTDFTEETEEIKGFVEEKTDELNKQIHDVKSQLRTIKENEITDYSYTLNDVEQDIANLRWAIKDVTSSTPVAEINQISRNIHNLTSSIDAISKNLTPAEIFQLKHGILKLNDDILSISSRTNKLLINSDEASKTISDGVEAFSHIAYNLEERIKEFSNRELVVQIADKLERILMLSENAATSDATVQKVLMFLGEWVDAVSETFEDINTKTGNISNVSDNISDALSELRKVTPEKSELFDKLEKCFEEQQSRIDRLESKLNKLTETVNANSISPVFQKIERLENIAETMNKSIEKLTSYVE